MSTSTARRGLTAAVPLAMIAAYVILPGFSTAGGPILNAYNLIAVMSALLLIGVVAVRRPRPVWPWLLIAGAVLSWVLGDAVYTWVGGSPVVSFADAFYVPAYVALIVVCFVIVRSRVGRRDTDSLIDSAMVTVAAAVALWELVIQPAWNTPGISWIEQMMASLYPLLDVILLGMLIQVLLVPGRRLMSHALLAAGMGAILLADTVYALLVQTNSYTGTPARLLDATWLLGYTLFLIAALHPSMQDLTARGALTDEPRRGRLFMAGVALVTVPVAVLGATLLGRNPGIETTVIGAALLVPLVLWRIVRLNHATETARGAVARQASYYRAVATNSSDTFVVIDRDAKVMDASAALEAFMGLAPEAVIGLNAMSVISEEDRDLAAALLADSLRKPGIAVAVEVRIQTNSGTRMWAELRCTNLLDDPDVRGVIVNMHDITRRKEIERELAHQAFHDSVTLLPNRALLKNRIDHALTRRPRGNDVAVVFCDLDGFKVVNDTLGHSRGDELLRVTGERLRKAVRSSDTVARLGGDEFAVLLEGKSASVEESGVLAERMRAAISDPVVVAGTPLVVTGSFGVAVASDTGKATSEDLLRDADIAMYRAKTAGRNRVAHYKPGMRAADLSRAQLESDLRFAVQHNELVVQYQPVIKLATRRLVGFEALVRWEHPTRGRLQPDDFIPIAEKTDTIIDIGTYVLNQACQTARSWQRRRPGASPLTIAVNMSARQLADPSVLKSVSSALEASGLPPDALVIELTESAIVEQPEQAAARFRALKAIGVQLAIDDFGVGYSSLSYLRQFPVDILKVDKSFVEGIHRDDRVPAIVHGLLHLAQTLGLETIAEGIETEVQSRSLAKEGCEFGQGYLFAKPLDEHAASRLVDEEVSLAETTAKLLSSLD